MFESELERLIIQAKCEEDHLFFTRYFFKARQNLSFRVNWHHVVISDALEKVFEGTIKNLVINVPPGGSKTELVIINFIGRGLAKNPYARFLHLSYADDLALLNSQSGRDLVMSDEYQALWPLKISNDSQSKKRWNVEVDGKSAGGVYATSLGGQITGFRAGHMAPGFCGAILLDDLLKPEDAFSKTKLAAANRKLLTTVKSRKANPETPVILIMQRISENDPVAFIKNGNLPGEWTYISIPAIIDQKYIESLEPKYQKLIRQLPESQFERFSYWPYKEPIEDLIAMERGTASDQTGARMSRHVFASQYMQNPVALGGNLIKGKSFVRYKVLPNINQRYIYADTAQKTAERNDFSVFGVFGRAENGKLYLIDLIRGKFESPELRRRAVEFWNKHKAFTKKELGMLRELVIEDKSSGTDLIQSLKTLNQIPIRGVQPHKDKLTRVMDAIPYIESEMVCIPEEASFISDFLTECEAFTADDSHAHDDQVDVLCMAIADLLSSSNSMNIWEKLASNS